MTVKIISKINTAQYNTVAQHPIQSWEWGEARKAMGIDVMRVGEYENESLVHTYQLTFHPIPFTPFTIGYLPRSDMPSQQALKLIDNEAKKRRAIFVKIEPLVSTLKDMDVNLLSKQVDVRPSQHPLFPKWTQIIDLTKQEDVLLKNMHPKTRYNIGLAKKKGVEIREVTNEEGFDIFSKLYFDTCMRQEYRGHTLNYHKIIFDYLKKDIAHILIAYFDNTPLSAYELFIFNDVLYYPYGGSSTENKNVMAPNLLMWEAIRFGKSLGAKKFDLWGSLPPDYDRNSPWAGFTRFKEGYGGDFVEFVGSFDLVLHAPLYNLYGIVHTLRRRLM